MPDSLTFFLCFYRPMDLEDLTYPAQKRKRTDPDNKECFDPKSPLLSFPPFEHLVEDDRLLASPTPVDTPTIYPTQSISERARERYLKQDPLALVLSPSSVECRQCKRKIKLSSKSAYDPFHWRNHRARCIKALKPKVKAMSKASTAKKYLSHPWSPQLPSLDKGSPMNTPPLISDREDDRVSDHLAGGEHANSPTPSTSESFAPSPKQEFSFTSLNTTFNDYLRRSHPDYAQPTATSFQPQAAAGRWRNWSWSQLEQPRFPVGDDNYDDNVDEDPLDPFELSSDIFRRKTASSVPFFS